MQYVFLLVFVYIYKETNRFFKPTVLPRKLIPNTFLLGCIIVLSIGSTKRRAFVAVIPSKRSMETTGGLNWFVGRLFSRLSRLIPIMHGGA